MIVQLKEVIKKTCKTLHINIHSPVLGIKKNNVIEFFEELDRKSIKYVILRWYDNLPYVEEGEDFDILVSNDDCKKLIKLLKHGNSANFNFIKCDVYPENNMKGFLAYYPPELAKRCLDNRMKKNGVWIMDDDTYFYSLLYHALFHKGYLSGIRSSYKLQELSYKPEHNYPVILAQMAQKIGLNTKDFSLEDYIDVLKKSDWFPPLDVLFRRSNKNSWISDYLSHMLPTEWFERYGVVCFVVRELGNFDKELQFLYEQIENAQAIILANIQLNELEKKCFAKYTRGGDWGKGPFRICGGLPARVLIVKKDMGQGKDNIPHGVVEYSWVKKIKEDVRKMYNGSVPYWKNANILHSTDNGVEASYYISILSKVTRRDYEQIFL